MMAPEDAAVVAEVLRRIVEAVGDIPMRADGALNQKDFYNAVEAAHGQARSEAKGEPATLDEWLPRGHPENPEHPQNRIGRLIDSLYAIRDSILNLDLKDALAGIDHALRMESVEPAADHHYQTPEGWQ